MEHKHIFATEKTFMLRPPIVVEKTLESCVICERIRRAVYKVLSMESDLRDCLDFSFYYAPSGLWEIDRRG